MHEPPEDWYTLDTREIAQRLLGCAIVRIERNGGRTGGRIVETEAYLADDPASHSFRGPTPRNLAMFGPPGRWYVYRSYGIHHCLNLVTAPAGIGEAVLIRSLEPLWGLSTMRRRRSRDSYELTNGPGKLAAALAIDDTDDGTPVAGEGATLLLLMNTETGADNPGPQRIAATPRIGISRAIEKFWRFTILENPWCGRPRPVSGLRPWNRPE